jgi:hypothetical protein
MAKIFFANTIGSTEPGTFLAIPTQSGEVMLERLGAGGTDEEKLAAFAEERGINDPRFLEQAKNFIGELELGRYGRPFMSSASSGGAWTRQENIGSFWDKYVAMIALGIKDIGVDKYSQISMTGNAYSYPQTRTFTTRLFDALVNQKGRVASVPLKLRSGQTVMGMVEASMNRDTQAIATVTSLTDFVADGDESVIDKMRVCSTNERGCLTSMGQRSVEFTSASGQDQFRAVQTLQNDSIAFSLVSSAAEIAKQRDEWLEKQRKANDQNADNLMKLSEGEGRFVAYAQALSRVPELAQAHLSRMYISRSTIRVRNAHVLGGDGMECFIDWSNPNYQYGESQYGNLSRSSDGGNSFQGINNNINEDGEWVTPWMQHPTNASILFAGFKNVWKSTNRGNSWSKISNLNIGGITIVKVAKSNPNYIYISNSTSIHKTTDGGASGQIRCGSWVNDRARRL